MLEGFRRQFVLVTVAGIPVRAGAGWFLVLLLLSLVTAASIDQQVADLTISLILGFAATAVFFLSIFIHEFAHAVAARMEDLEVVEIVLHPFGGLTRFRHEPQTPRAEFRIALAGPAASFVLAIIFIGLMAAANAGGLDILGILLFLLGLSNFLLAVFNLLPGYPLDGGRVLRAYLWRSGREMNAATVITGRFGKAIGLGLIAIGFVVMVIRGEIFTGAWAVVVGFFLYDSAKGIIAAVKRLDRVIVDDVMRLPVSVEPGIDLMHFIDHILPMHRQPVFPVASGGELYGMLLIADIKRIARDRWRSTAVSDVMRPVVPEQFVETMTPVADARELMEVNGIGAVGVIDSRGRLVGFLQSPDVK